MIRTIPLLLLAFLLGVPPAFAESVNEAEWCPDQEPELSLHREFRALSLDMRGVIPTEVEYEALDGESVIPSSVVLDWLDSAEFAARVVRKHRELYWNNISNVPLLEGDVILNNSNGVRWRRGRAAEALRGNEVPCRTGDDDQAEFDDLGRVIAELQPDGTTREGWVEVAPYWNPDTTIRVCAYDAQETIVSPLGGRCDTTAGFSDPFCGCGPGLAWCRYGQTVNVVLESMAQELEQRIAYIVENDMSYLELFTGSTAMVNGPLAHFWRWQTGMAAGVSLEPSPVPAQQVPDLEWGDADTWVPIDLGPEHAGLLTSPSFLLRFQTNRSRANRYFNSFLCQPFQPPAGGIPASDDESAQVLDLQLRDGCKYCHSLLEPSAAYWGRWPEVGLSYLPEDGFPSYREDCYRCAMTGQNCSPECTSHYLTDALTPEETSWLGHLRSYQYRRQEHHINVESGPKLLVHNTTVDGRLPSCVSRTAAEWLMGRELNEGEEGWVQELTHDFVSSDYDYKALVQQIVESPVYRRVR